MVSLKKTKTKKPIPPKKVDLLAEVFAICDQHEINGVPLHSVIAKLEAAVKYYVRAEHIQEWHQRGGVFFIDDADLPTKEARTIIEAKEKARPIWKERDGKRQRWGG